MFHAEGMGYTIMLLRQLTHQLPYSILHQDLQQNSLHESCSAVVQTWQCWPLQALCGSAGQLCAGNRVQRGSQQQTHAVQCRVAMVGNR